MRIWRNDIQNCPLNKRIHFLCNYSHNGTVLHEIIGTLRIDNYSGSVTKGICIEGNPNIFYKSEIVMWACYNTNEEAECLYR